MDTPLKFPYYIKLTLWLLCGYLLASILYSTQDLLLPLLYAFILAVLVSPMVDFLESKKINRTIAITCVMLLSIFLISITVILLLSQISRLSETMPELTDKFEALLQHATAWTSRYFDIRESKINLWFVNTRTNLLENSGVALGSTLSTIGGILAATVLTPVYVFMILYYQNHLLGFIHKAFSVRQNIEVKEIFTETKAIIQSYLVGIFFEFCIIATLNCLGLLILDIPYAVLLGISGALLNVIPYLGGLIAVVLYMIVALVTKDPIYMMYVAILYMFIQFVDNNFIVPKIVGSRVKLNALVSIIAVIVGAALWGIPGMFLSILLTAILKLILDRIKTLSHWGFLLGETIPPFQKHKIQS